MIIEVTLITGEKIEVDNPEELTAKQIQQVLCNRTHLMLYNHIFKVEDISVIEVI